MKKSDDSRFQQDASGQWWWVPANPHHRRTRAIVGRCGSCSEEFLTRGSEVRQFCSPECHYASIRRTKPPCIECGQPIQSKYAERYCSHSCAAAARHHRAPRTTTTSDSPATQVGLMRLEPGDNTMRYQDGGTPSLSIEWSFHAAYE